MRIAIVCLGNICRSPMGEVVLRTLVERRGVADVSVESYGTASYHEGSGADRRSEQALVRAGWPSGNHCARGLRAADLDRLDLVLCADRANLADVQRLARRAGSAVKVELLRDYDPLAGPGDDEVPDPWSGDARDFDLALEMIERSCAGVIDRLGLTSRSVPGVD